MLEQIIQFQLFLIVALTSTFVFVGVYVKKERDFLQKILVSVSVFAIAIIIGSSIKVIEFSILWLVSYLIFGLLLLIIRSNSVTPIGMLTGSILLTTVTLLIPFDNIVFSEESFISLELILFILDIIVYILLYQQFHKAQEQIYSNLLIVLSIGIISGFLVEEIYHLTVMTLVFSIILWYAASKVTSDNDKLYKSLEEKLHKLDNEFQYELRKEVNKHTFHLKEVQEKMSHINKIDNLTKSYNKKAIFNIIEELTLDRRVEHFSLIMFDLDHFKNLNDTLGHVQGDLCLKTLASIARDCIRDSDSLGRYGGDEFIIVLPKSSLSTAITIAERFRDNIDKKTQPHFTVSIGLATYPEDGKTLKDLLDVADKGLYLSKEKGRNAVSYNNPSLDKKY
ncbi:MAG: GGDEF domain-containing protein [Clostridiales bacterium]|nr:GGDEF domain-containing protein [Clostridiales bacterium]